MQSQVEVCFSGVQCNGLLKGSGILKRLRATELDSCSGCFNGQKGGNFLPGNPLPPQLVHRPPLLPEAPASREAVPLMTDRWRYTFTVAFLFS